MGIWITLYTPFVKSLNWPMRREARSGEKRWGWPEERSIFEIDLKVLTPVIGIIAFSGALAAQTPRVEPLLDQGYRQMYNLKFDEAHRTFAAYERDHPADPLGTVSDAAA